MKYMQVQKRKKRNPIQVMLLTIVIIFVVGAAVVLGLFHVRQADVIGNEFYSASEIKKMVMSDSMGENTLYLLWKYSQEDAAESLPFLSAVDVTMINPYYVQFHVYEKTIVGYLMYGGSMIYFDKDGVVVEISQELREGVPPFSGIAIAQPVVSEKLPIADEEFFETLILEAQILKQSGLEPDEVHYDEKKEMILYFGSDIRVLMGDSSYMEEKMQNLSALFPELEGLSGTLHMENYTSGTTAISFKKGEKGEEELIMNVNQPEESEESEDTEGLEGDTSEGENPEGENSDGQNSQSEQNQSGYVEDPSRIATDANGSEYYTDPAGNVTYNMDQQYLGDDGQVITDGYGYIDPYTGAYILN